MDYQTLSLAVKEGNQEQTVELIKSALDAGTLALDILEKGLVPGVQALGELFKDGTAFLPEILISVRAMKKGLEVIESQLVAEDIPNKGNVVLGTVRGDLHDIGKNLVGMMLTSNGFNVIDVGVDASSDKFVEAVVKHEADIVAISALLTTTVPYLKKVVDALEEAGLRDKVKVMIGGAPLTRESADEINAEGFADDCVRAVDEAKRLLAIE